MPLQPIVVGIDGSECSKTALGWAGRYSTLTGTPLKAMAVWHEPWSFGWLPPSPDDRNPHEVAFAMLEQVVKDVLGSEFSEPLTKSVKVGSPAHALTEESRTASLIVVGSRGHGEVAGILLGSVSEFLVAHAHCPVVVVRDGTEA